MTVGIVLGFLFSSPWIALGVAGACVAVPILIHLFNRRRYQVIPWAAMRFLLAAEKQNVRRMRLEQFLLLAVRALVVLCLLLAMVNVTPWAQAFWNHWFPEYAGTDTEGQRIHKILVLDGSYSMGLKANQETCFEEARQQAIQLVKKSRGGDGFSVVLMALPPVRVVPEAARDADKVIKALRNIQMPHGNANVGATLRVVQDMIRRSPANFDNHQVYFFTDLQRSTWVEKEGKNPAPEIKAGLARLHHEARVEFLDVGRDGVDNVAVTGLALKNSLATTNEPTPIKATLHKFGSPGAREVTVHLLVGEARTSLGTSSKKGLPGDRLRIVATRKVRVPSGTDGLALEFQHSFTKPGDYIVQVRMQTDDLEVDNARAMLVTLRSMPLRVLLVNGKPWGPQRQQASFWLEKAINPFPAGETKELPQVKVLTETQFADATLGKLDDFDCVFLCDVARLSSDEVRRLEEHLRRGGGVVFCLGPQVDRDAWNRLIYRGGAGILPAKLGAIQEAPEERPYQFFADEEGFQQPPLAAFSAPAYRSSFLVPRFRRYVRVELPASGHTRTLLSFKPLPLDSDKFKVVAARNDPAVLVAPYFRGRSILITTSVNMDWTSWPLSKNYLEFMHELLRFAVAGQISGKRLDLASSGFQVGEPVEEYLPSGSGYDQILMQKPDGQEVKLHVKPLEEADLVRFSQTDQSGIYQLRMRKDSDTGKSVLFPINPPIASHSQQGQEGDLARISKEELLTFYLGTAEIQPPRSKRQAAAPGEEPAAGLGTRVAHVLLLTLLALVLIEVVLAWKLGHHRKSADTVPETTRRRILPVLVGMTAALLLVALAGVLIHEALTGDLLGFLPEAWRAMLAAALDAPQAAPGESIHWRLIYSSYLPGDPALQPWLVAGLCLAVLGLVFGIYWNEGRTASTSYRFLLAGLRGFFLLMLLVVFLTQLKVVFLREEWPDVAIIVDVSQSMSVTDRYQDQHIQAAADQLAPVTGKAPTRLELAQALLTHPDKDWLQALANKYRFKVHVYACADRTRLLADISSPDQCAAAIEALQTLQADGDSSRLASGVRHAIDNDLEKVMGSSLAAAVVLTDGIATDPTEKLTEVAPYADEREVALYFLGLGDAHELQLHNVEVADSVLVNDRLVFNGRITALGHATPQSIPVTLGEKVDGRIQVLGKQKVTIDPRGEPVKFSITHQPTGPGEKTYVLEIPDPGAPGKVRRRERKVLVRESAKPLRILYIEGFARPEFKYVKTLLERESAADPRNKTVDLKVLLLEAQDLYPTQDKSALADFPTREELNQYDAVILGDVNLQHAKLGTRNLALLRDFVRERGGGLLVIPGAHFGIGDYRRSPLAEVLPIRALPRDSDNVPADVDRTDGFRPKLTDAGREHEMFRFSSDEPASQAIWKQLPEMYWWASDFTLQPAARVLAVHPAVPAMSSAEPGAPSTPSSKLLPLIVEHPVGAGKCLFVGVEETWRWAFRENLTYFNQFWFRTVKYLAKKRTDRIELELNEDTPYRRGSTIRVTVRFPSDAVAPAPGRNAKVVVERRPLPGSAATAGRQTSVQTIELKNSKASRLTYQGEVPQSPEGEYAFWLSSPAVTGVKPRAQCLVLPPPGEMEQLMRNQGDMASAASVTKGGAFTLASADQLIQQLVERYPLDKRVTWPASRSPWLLWNQWLAFLLALGLIAGEWILRKRKHLL